MHNFRASEEIQEVLRCFIHFVQNDANFTPIIKSIDNCTIHYYDNELSEADDIADKIARFITSGIEEKRFVYWLNSSQSNIRKNFEIS